MTPTPRSASSALVPFQERAAPPAPLRSATRAGEEEEDDDGSEVGRPPDEAQRETAWRSTDSHAGPHSITIITGGETPAGGRKCRLRWAKEVKSIAPPGGKAMRRQRRRGGFLSGGAADPRALAPGLARPGKRQIGRAHV